MNTASIPSSGLRPPSPRDRAQLSPKTVCGEKGAIRPCPKIKHGHLAVVFGLFVMPVLFVGVVAIVQQRRHDQLNADIIAAGGELKLPPPIWTIHWNKWHRRSIFEGTVVKLTGDSLPRHFLRDGDFLRHLDITNLELREVTSDAKEFAELVAAHPVEQFMGHQIQGVDQIAAALREKTRISAICITESDLSDKGFAALPLEHVLELSVRETDVTPDGLQELRRCQNLRILWISGTQLDERSINVIGQLPHAVSLTVHDSVSANLLRQFKGSRVRRIRLYNCPLGTEEVNQLERELSDIEVIDD